jgi:hypothetical protein
MNYERTKFRTKDILNGCEKKQTLGMKINFGVMIKKLKRF